MDEISKHLIVSKDTVYTWISAKGMLAHHVGRLCKLKREEVDGWVESGRASDRQNPDPDGKEGR